MQKHVKHVDLVKSSPNVSFLNLLFEQIANSNEYLLAKFGFDTAENKPCKVCPLSAYRLLLIPQVGLPQAMRRAGYEDAVIFGSAMMHYSIDKAADILGFGAAAMHKIPTDDAFRVDISALKTALAALPPKTKVVAIVGVAGTTESGSVDDLEALASIARNCGAHFHVSGKRFSSSLIYFEELN